MKIPGSAHESVVLGVLLRTLIETIFMSTHNICFT